MTPQYNVEKNVPIPPLRGINGDLKRALLAMAVGDSITVTHYASGTISEIKKLYPDRRFTRKREQLDFDKHVRVWRVA